MRLITTTILALLAGAWLSLGCKEQKAAMPDETSVNAYPIEPVNIRNVKMTDDFWLPIIKKVQEKTIAYALKKCEEEGRMDNFLIAGGKMDGETKGQMPFDDTDLYKIIEGASNSLISTPNPALEQLLDSLIAIIAVGQEADGYLTTWRTINPAKPPAPWVPVKEGKRWESLGASHELYNAGHLYEAAYTHFIATNKRNFLDIALKNADLLVSTFGDGEGKVHAVPGHQIVETGLLKLYKATQKPEYLQLARYFLDNRGNPANHELYGPYSQDHIPVTKQTEVVGHAVRAMYMYAAMTDVAVFEQDSAYNAAVQALWHNMVEKKMYITGGIGARHEGEAFGEDYELPNLTSYNETCAAIGSVYWNQRLHSQTGDVKYLDVIERTLYNGLISGLSLDGTNFFYPNALEADGKYTFNRGACTRQGWFDCSCCPTNLIRFLPAMPGLLYSRSGETIYINLYASSTASMEVAGAGFTLQQTTNYPWDGLVTLTVQPEKATEATIKFRIPSWARNSPLPGGLYHYRRPAAAQSTISVNGTPMQVDTRDGYFTFKRKWDPGDVVVLNFPMTAQLVEADEKIQDDIGKVTLERGPLVYAIEEVDNEAGFDGIEISPSDQFEATMEKDLLGGVVTLNDPKMKAVPYYAWSNRGVGKMKVWINFNGK